MYISIKLNSKYIVFVEYDDKSHNSSTNKFSHVFFMIIQSPTISSSYISTSVANTAAPQLHVLAYLC